MSTLKRLKAPFDGYGVDSDGNVWSFKGADGKKSKVAVRDDKSGYKRVNLADQGASKNGFKEVYVHKLVAQAFLKKGEGEIMHLDGNKANNKASNLAYGSKSENAKERESRKREDSDLVEVPEWLELRADACDYWKPRWELTPEGYLRADNAIIAKEGVLDYGDHKEWVTKSALESLASTLIGKPITREHPTQREVTAKTAKSLVEGAVLSAYVGEDDDGTPACLATLMVYDESLVRDVLAGMKEVSPGYDATLSMVPDNQTEKFGGATFLQTGRHANHLAITRAGRGGPDVSIRLDAEGIPMEDKELKEKLDALQQKVDALSEENAALKAKNDAFEKMNEKSKEDEDEKKNDSKMVAYFNDRVAALEVAKRVGVQVNDSATNAEIKAAVCNKALGESTLRLDSEAALDAAFEVVAKMTPKNQALGEVLKHNDALASQRQDSASDDLFNFYAKRG